MNVLRHSKIVMTQCARDESDLFPGFHIRTVVQDWVQGYVYVEPVRNGSKWIRSENRNGMTFCLHGTVLEPVRNGSKTAPSDSAGPVLDPYQTGSKRSHVNRSRCGPVLSKRSLRYSVGPSLVLLHHFTLRNVARDAARSTF